MELKHEQLWPVVHTRLREYMTASNWDIEAVATGTCSTTETVAGWLSGKEAAGERLIKLWHLLAALGCDSPEMEQLGRPNFLCGQLLTFGIVGLDELQEVIGVQNPQAVLRMLRGSEPMRWHYPADALTELYGDQLNEALARLPQLGVKSAVTLVKSVASTKRVPSLAAAGKMAESMGAGNEKLLITAAILSAALPLVRYLNSDDCTPEDRSKLRSLMGEAGMFELSNHFNSLCSERARNTGR